MGCLSLGGLFIPFYSWWGAYASIAGITYKSTSGSGSNMGKQYVNMHTTSLISELKEF